MTKTSYQLKHLFLLPTDAAPQFLEKLTFFNIHLFFLKIVDSFFVDLGERILKEEKEMREMKAKLQAIEVELQALYRGTGDESEVTHAQ